MARSLAQQNMCPKLMIAICGGMSPQLDHFYRELTLCGSLKLAAPVNLHSSIRYWVVSGSFLPITSVFDLSVKPHLCRQAVCEVSDALTRTREVLIKVLKRVLRSPSRSATTTKQSIRQSSRSCLETSGKMI